LTEWWYRPDKKWLENLRDEGFEIGLHGRFHDPGIAYRSRAKITDELKRALDALPEGVTGYRSPALSVSDTLYGVLEELGFTHDSSLLVLNRYGAGCPLLWPFKIGSITELPLTMQDDLLFRDMCLDVETALRITLERMDETLRAGGWFVLNTHPGVLDGRLNYYESLLSAVSERGIKPITAMEAVKAIEPHPAR
jgi:peptidoglycan/xylan/chitin deacetylase (PgdA/CDA1 family)